MGTTRQKSSCRNRLQNGPHSLLRMKVGTHSPLPTGSHTAAYTAKHGALSSPGHSTVLSCQRNRHRKNSRRKRMHASWRVSASSGVAAPLGCVTFFSFVEIALVRPTLRAFYTCKVWGCYHCSRYAWCIAKVFRAQVSKRLTFAPTVRSW